MQRLLPYTWSVWALSRSLAATWEITVVFFSSGYLDVSVRRVSLLLPYIFRQGWHRFACAGFPHSDIHGSRLAYSSPWRFAVGRVLLRLLVPRHPPYALLILTFSRDAFSSLIIFLFSMNCFPTFLLCAVFKELFPYFKETPLDGVLKIGFDFILRTQSPLNFYIKRTRDYLDNAST